jgi:hypothetical protein
MKKYLAEGTVRTSGSWVIFTLADDSKSIRRGPCHCSWNAGRILSRRGRALSFLETIIFFWKSGGVLGGESHSFGGLAGAHSLDVVDPLMAAAR